MDALIGDTGFVGGNLLRQHGFAARYNSRTIDGIRGTRVDTLVFAGAQARKYWANAEPEADWQGIARALDALAEVDAVRAVLISTIDVLPRIAGLDESADCHALPNHAYGRNRLRLEDAFRARFADLVIVRLPGVFGHGLKKNVIFDLLHDNLLEQVNPASRFQFYDLAGLWDDIQRVRAAGIDLIHLFPEPVATADILARFFPGKPVGGAAGPAVAYDCRTRHGAVFGRADGYVQGREAVLERLGRYIAAVRGGAAA